MITRSLLFALSAFAAIGCASHASPAPVGDSSKPRIGWVIMQGSADNPDEEFVCQSNPRDACTVKASTADRKSFAEVHLYFHPIGTPTQYQGTRQIAFLGSTRPSPIAVSIGGNDVGNDSVVGIVTEQPGDYALTVSATAKTPGGPVEVSDRVDVTVK